MCKNVVQDITANNVEVFSFCITRTCLEISTNHKDIIAHLLACSQPPFTMSVRFNDNIDLMRGNMMQYKQDSFKVGALTTYEALVSGGDRKKEILLRRGKGNVDKIMADVIREMVQQKLASIHYEAMSNYALFMPTMLITLTSAGLSILATSDLIEDAKVKTKLTILVAFLQLCLATLCVLVQSRFPWCCELSFYSPVPCLICFHNFQF